MTMKAMVKARFSRNVWRAIRDVRYEFYLQRLHRASMKKAARLARVRPLRLNLGSGFQPRPGWINVDLSNHADLQLDLREPLPFPDDSVRAIYTEHFFEHLSYPNLDDETAWQLETPEHPSEGLTFLRECRRVLEPGGTFDIVVPDAEGIIREYVFRHEQPFPQHAWWGPKWCDTPLHCVNYVFRQGREHKYAYDEETLEGMLVRAGFADVARRPFDPTLEAENHRIGSLCVRARKEHPGERPTRVEEPALAGVGRA
jgi:predicted SAM-dependent methyltransferase